MTFQKIQKKIRLAPGIPALIVNAPPAYLKLMQPLAFDTKIDNPQSRKYDFIQVFGEERSELEQLVKKYYCSGKYDCLFWICYPKVGGKIKSNINRNVVWMIAEGIGMQCVTQVAIDETWTAMRCRPSEMVGK